MITMLIEGERITDIARKIGVSRTSIYTWKDNDEVKAELNRRTQDIKNQGNAYILKDVRTYIDEIKNIAKNSTDQRVKLSANRYLLDRTLGTPTTTGDEDMDNNSDSVNENELEEQLKKFRNMKVVK
jgi:transposase